MQDQPTIIEPQIRNWKQIRKHMTSGCDERIYLDDSNLNSYKTNPLGYKNLVHRGSCTGGTLNDDNVRLMDNLLDSNLSDPVRYEQLLAEQTAELKELINYQGEDEFDIFYAPSGSDLVYFPALFCKIMHPERPVLNLLSCPEELGSGTLLAVKGEFHANNNQFDESVVKGDKVDPASAIKVLSLSARGEDGKIINHKDYILEQINKHPNHSIIVSLVYGSKSGIEDNLNIMDKVDREDVIWTIDMCQFRHSKKIIHRILDKNGCIMITGSKFYQAPPFCGSLLVSRHIMDQLKQGDLSKFEKLRPVLSSYDFPASIRKMTNLPNRMNIGLRLRWACSLNEIRKFRKIPRHPVTKKIGQWNDFITEQLSNSPEFELMPDQRITNKTIISFRIRKGDKFLNHAELKQLYSQVVIEGRIGGQHEKKVYVGQPVAYGEKSFLRVAIGSMCIREFIKNDETEFAEDAEILSIIRSKIKMVETA